LEVLGMAETTIEWADYTFNPWIGCEKVSAGCKLCYASVDTFARTSKARGLPLWGPGSTRHRTREANWQKVRAWNRKAREAREQRARLAAEVPWDRPRVFCASLADVFEARPELDAWRADLWALIQECTELDWLLLTKRPENVRGMVPARWLGRTQYADEVPGRWPSHVWLGTSIEDQEQADARIPHLLAVHAPVRFLSLEPLIGRVDLSKAYQVSPERGGTLAYPLEVNEGGYQRVDWMIIGGESGPGARPCDVAWIRDLVRQGRAAGVATFVKQLGAMPLLEYKEATPDEIAAHRRAHPRHKGTLGGTETYLRLSDKKGGDMAEWPEDLRVRELPIR
jgi:protein gp37